MSHSFSLRHDNLQAQGLLLLEAVSGSRAYGLALPSSDTDLKGVFFLPRKVFFGLEYLPQVSNPSNDLVYYELGRFFELLGKNNPTLLELLGTPEEHVRFRHPLLHGLAPEMFLSKLCKDTFAGYAVAQIRKARGLNKKIHNPMDRRRKSLLEFCYVVRGAGTLSVPEWLHRQGFRQEDCGLAKMSHARDLYALYHDSQAGFKGIIGKDSANEVALSSIPVGLKPVGHLSFNKDGYTRYCKDYQAYWDWVEKRNDSRYESTLQHGHNYDAKNMMHTFRLLDMAAEIARFREVRVHREDRDFYLSIRAGEHSYDNLMEMAQQRLARMEGLYADSRLPDRPDPEKVERELVRIREGLYG